MNVSAKLSIASSVFLLACINGSEPGVGEAKDELSEDAGSLGSCGVEETLTVSCSRLCNEDDCGVSSDRDKLIEELREVHGRDIAVVPASPKDAYRFKEPCSVFHPTIVDEKWEGFTINVVVLPMPSGSQEMDWSACQSDIEEVFATVMKKDESKLAGSTIGTITKLSASDDRAKFSAQVVDANGNAYYEYQVTFNQACTPASYDKL